MLIYSNVFFFFYYMGHSDEKESVYIKLTDMFTMLLSFELPHFEIEMVKEGHMQLLFPKTLVLIQLLR